MTSPLSLEVIERLNTLLDRMIRQTERMDVIIAEMEKRIELRQPENQGSP